MTPDSPPKLLQSNFIVRNSDDSIPELLMLRFVGSECVQGHAGGLWQEMFSVSRDITDDLFSVLPSSIVELLLAECIKMSMGEFRFLGFRLLVRSHFRMIEAEIVAQSNNEHLVLLRDVTIASQALAHFEQSVSLFALLTSREREVLCLVLAGNPNKTVASKLQLSEKTVEKHRANIMRKTGARHVAELVRLTYPVFAEQKTA